MRERKVGVGLLGCGNIAPKYVRGLRMWNVLDIVACADLDLDAARALAAAHDIPHPCSVDELLTDDDVEIVVNLTSHQAHATVGPAVIAANKHLYSEKPLTATRAEGRAILEAAEHRSIVVGCAPDTFLGGGLQTCRRLIDGEAIGEPIAAYASYFQPHPDAWHPNAESYYRPGGPTHALGSYLVTALVALLGPVAAVTGSAKRFSEARRIASGARAGTTFAVEVPTHVTATLDFVSGAVATIVASYEMRASSVPELEIYGTDGAIQGPHVDSYAGPVRISNGDGWVESSLSHSPDVYRGTGVADLAHAILAGRQPRPSGELGLHVVDVLQGIEESAERGQTIATSTTCDRPAPLLAGVEISEEALWVA